MGEIMYATREDVRHAVDEAGASRDAMEIDRALAAATEKINGALKRDFAPWTGTKYFDWPNLDTTVFRVYLDIDAQLIRLDSLTSGGVPIDVAKVNLEPNTDGPPYNIIEVNRDTVGSYLQGNTFQRSIAAVGLWGFDLVEKASGTLSGTLSSGAATFTLPAGTGVGVGTILRLDSERVIVTELASVATGQVCLSALADDDADRLMTVADPTQFGLREVISMGAEQCEVLDIQGTTLVLRRAVSGSLLTTHAGDAIYAQRLASIDRGQLGTAAASHSGAAVLNRHMFPPLIRQYAIAEALIELSMQASSYARTRPAAGGIGGRGVPLAETGPVDIREQALSAYGRYGRARAI
jgi:hypothetical protein